MEGVLRKKLDYISLRVNIIAYRNTLKVISHLKKCNDMLLHQFHKLVNIQIGSPYFEKDKAVQIKTKLIWVWTVTTVNMHKNKYIFI